MILLLSLGVLTNSQHFIDDDDDGKLLEDHTQKPCGPLGFRCISETSYQICGDIYSDGETDLPEKDYNCNDGLICDEENQSYCSTNEPRIIKRNDDDDNFSISEDFITEIPEYACSSPGYYPDYLNKSLFWMCDVSDNGNGFIVRHMLCDKNRLFDSRYRSCVLRGTTRNTRTNLQKHCDKDHKRFRDKKDCTSYFVCFDNGNQIIKMKCPELYKFSIRHLRCLPQNLVNCHV